MVPDSVVTIEPVPVPTVGVIWLAAIVVNVNTRVPAPEGTLTTILVGSGPGGAMVWAVGEAGEKVTTALAAIPKFPVDAVAVPGLTIVFCVVFAAMFPVFTVATPPFPGVKPKLPLAGTAYAVLLISAATN